MGSKEQKKVLIGNWQKISEKETKTDSVESQLIHVSLVHTIGIET